MAAWAEGHVAEWAEGHVGTPLGQGQGQFAEWAEGHVAEWAAGHAGTSVGQGQGQVVVVLLFPGAVYQCRFFCA